MLQRSLVCYCPQPEEFGFINLGLSLAQNIYWFPACSSTSAFKILQLDVDGTEVVRDYNHVIFPSVVTTVMRCNWTMVKNIWHSGILSSPCVRYCLTCFIVLTYSIVSCNQMRHDNLYLYLNKETVFWDTVCQCFSFHLNTFIQLNYAFNTIQIKLWKKR